MKKFSATILIIIIFFYLLVEFIGDRLIKNIFENNISSTLNRDVKIEKLNIKYLKGKANARGISLLNKKFDGYLLRIETIEVDLDAFSIFTNDVIINNVLLENGIEAYIIRNAFKTSSIKTVTSWTVFGNKYAENNLYLNNKIQKNLNLK